MFRIILLDIVWIYKFVHKMKPLLISKSVMSWLCMYTGHKFATTIWQRIVHIVFTSIIITSIFSCVAAHLTFFLKFFSIDLQRSLFSAMIIILFIPLCYVILIAPCLRQNIQNIFEMLSLIYDASKLLNTT